MLGLFQENGPCRINNASTAVALNPFSWNNVANVLYIDQPVGVGFSHGTMDVGTSEEAAADVWTFLQIFLSDSRFSGLQSHDLAIWTESYVLSLLSFSALLTTTLRLSVTVVTTDRLLPREYR